MRFLLAILIMVMPILLPAQGADVFHIDRLPNEGVHLDKGWKWQSGDDPELAMSRIDENSCQPVNPASDIHDLPHTNRVNVLIRIGSHYYFHQFDSALVYAKEALALSEKLNYRDGRVIAILWLKPTVSVLSELLILISMNTGTLSNIFNWQK